MKLLVLLATAVTLASAAGLDKCTWGESYWCSHIGAAKDCNAIQHCTTTVWAHQRPFEGDNNDICQYCENFLIDAKKVINQTLSEVQKYLDSACSVIPSKEIADKCTAAVNTYLPEIIQLIENGVNPKAICSAIGLCQGFLDRVHHSLPVSVKGIEVNGDICADCKAFIGDIRDTVTSKATEGQIEQMLKSNVCARLGSLEAECDQLVQSYTPEALALIASQVDPSMVCASMGVCPGNGKEMMLKAIMASALRRKALKANGAECDLCKEAITEVKTLVEDPAIQKEILDLIHTDVCASLGSFKAECDSQVDKYAPMVFELLAAELDPNTDCSALGMCPAEVNVIPDVVRQNTLPSKAEVEDVDTSPECILCEFVMDKVESIIGNNATEQEIIQALDKVCIILPTTIAEECKQFIDTYGPAIIDLLVQELDPSVICSTLGLCKTSSKKLASPVTSGIECTVCEAVMTEVDTLISGNETKAELEELLKKVCTILPDTLQAQCTDFINTYGAAVIDLLVQQLTPKEVCTTIGLCPSGKLKAAQAKPALTVGDSEACGICETVIQYVNSLLVENSTVVEIEKVLDKVCNFLPTTMGAECDAVVQTYGPALINLIAQMDDPREICSAIKLCKYGPVLTPGKLMAAVNMNVVPEKAHMLGENECTYGPAFWCESMENAKKCKAVDHCNTHVWKN